MNAAEMDSATLRALAAELEAEMKRAYDVASDLRNLAKLSRDDVAVRKWFERAKHCKELARKYKGRATRAEHAQMKKGAQAHG